MLNLYIFMSVFLAVVYNQFKENLKREVRENVERRDALLDKVSTSQLVTSDQYQ